jgi:dienelactone hydrolase
VLFGGSQGGNPMRYTAQMFASRGYVAASVIYFGAPATPPTLVDVPVEIGGRAVQAVARRSDVDAAHVAVMGSSKGGEYALLVASTYPEVKAVIAYVPSPFAWFGLGVRGSPTACSWSRAGKALPCVAPDAAAGQAVWRQIQAHEEVAFRPSYDEARVHADADAMAAAFFPLERIQGPVLCLAGDDDQMWSSRIHCELALDYLRQHHHSYADRMVSYPNAGHLFIIAKGGPSSAMNSISAGSFKMLFGGTPAGDALAAQAAWAEIYAFLGAAFNPAAAAGMHDDR